MLQLRKSGAIFKKHDEAKFSMSVNSVCEQRIKRAAVLRTSNTEN
jgi:hypothetical protein